MVQSRWANAEVSLSSTMNVVKALLNKLGFRGRRAERSPIRVFLLDDDTRRHEWFSRRFRGDHLDIAYSVERAREYLSGNAYDAIFLDHDLLPEHYTQDSSNDQETGFAI